MFTQETGRFSEMEKLSFFNFLGCLQIENDGLPYQIAQNDQKWSKMTKSVKKPILGQKIIFRNLLWVWVDFWSIR